MKTPTLLAASALLLLSSAANAQVSLNIYNNNLALIKDIRDIDLKEGRQKLYFDGVSANLNPQSSFILGHEINVIEKNYNYKLINKDNMLDYYVGKEVKTIATNPQNGQDIIKDATVLSNNYGVAVLEFDEGIEVDYKGRIIFEELPISLSTKPQLEVVLDSKAKGKKALELLYLTSGLEWNADYIADIKSDDTIDINTWVTLTNNSGVEYKDAKIRVIAGDINQTSPMPRNDVFESAQMMYKSKATLSASGATNSAKPVGDYYFYELENKTTIKDKQSKQVALFDKKDVKYKKEYKFSSPLYIAKSSKASEFDKVNPSVIFNIKNDEASNLGILLPSGTIRFYEDSKDNTTFLGEAQISQTAKGETVELSIGTTSDFYAKGKISNVSQISKEISDIEIQVDFYNTKDTAQEVIFEQNIYGDWRILEESIASEKKNSQTAKWLVSIPAKAKTELKYKLRLEN